MLARMGSKYRRRTHSMISTASISTAAEPRTPIGGVHFWNRRGSRYLYPEWHDQRKHSFLRDVHLQCHLLLQYDTRRSHRRASPCIVPDNVLKAGYFMPLFTLVPSNIVIP